MIKPNLKRIPEELKKCNHWVTWKEKHRKGQRKPTKPPYDARTGKHAKVNDSKTWTDFQTAATAYTNRDHDGVGFNLTKDDKFTGIDLDDCFINGKITPEAKEIVDRFHSYTERSPSGNGLRIFIEGDLHGGGRRKGNIEFYSSDHYLTVTGRHYPIKRLNPRKIQNRQEELDKIYDEIFADDPENETEINLDYEPLTLKKSHVALRGKAHFNADWRIQKKFSTLFNKGDWKSLNYKSQSEADLALCNLLAQIFEGDPVYIDSAFRVSAIMRSKWNRKGYRENTIKKAISYYEKTLTTKSAEILNWEDIKPAKYFQAGSLSATELKDFIIRPIEMILDPWLEMPSISYIYGNTGCGKTIFILSLLKHIVCGKKFGEWEVVNPVKSLYFDAEMSIQQLKRYIAPLEHIGKELVELRLFSTALTQRTGGYQQPNLFDSNWQNVMKEILIEEKFKLWIFDNVFSGSTGNDPNDARTWGQFNQWLVHLRSIGISTILIDHAGKTSGDLFGSSRKIVPAEIKLKLVSQGIQKNEILSFITKFEKARIDKRNAKIDPQFFSYSIADGKGTWRFNKSIEISTKIKVLNFISNGTTNQNYIAKEIGIKQPMVNKHLKKLKEEKLVKGKGRKLEITDAGREALKF
jgi:hypothetical protein